MKQYLIVTVLVLLLSVGLSSPCTAYLTQEWKHHAKGGNAALSVVDIDKDGNKEILAGFYSDGYGYLFDKDGEKLWGLWTIVGVEAAHSADINNDGEAEMFFGAGRTFYAANKEGEKIFRLGTKGSIERIGSGDFNNDGFIDIIFASQDVRSANIYVLDRNNTILWKKKVGGGETPDFSIDDFNHDGKNEVAISAGKFLSLYDSDSNLLWNYGVSGSTTGLEIADIDNDGSVDFIVGATTGVYAVNNEGNEIWTFEGEKIEALKGSDIDRDGNMEVVAGGYEKVYLLDNNGNPIWSRNATRQTNVVETGDLDRDGDEEIIAGSDILHVFDTDGNIRWEFSPYLRVMNILVTDLDSDGNNELLMGSLDNSLYLFKPREIYIEEDKSHRLFSEAEEFFSRGEYEKALESIQQAIDISPGKCTESPEECTALLEQIDGKITVSTTTIPPMVSIPTETQQETGNSSNMLTIAVALLILLIVTAVVLKLRK